MDFNCEICDVKFATKFLFNRHQNRKHAQKEDVKPSQEVKLNNQCNTCKKYFFKKTMLIDHLNDYHGMDMKKEVMEFSNISGKFDTQLN